MPLALVAIMVCATATCTDVLSQDPSPQETTELHVSVIDPLDALVKSCAAGEPVTLATLDPLYRAAVIQYGSVEELLGWIADQREQATDDRARALAEIEVHVAARRGDLQRASDVLQTLLKDPPGDDARVDLQIWNARLLDALGDVDDAKQAYQDLIERDLNESDQQMVRLRLALMGLIGTEEGRPKTDAKELIELAKNSKDASFRNRAANVLAVQDQHSEAVKLFVIEGEGTIRFRSASRVAEWAIRANDRDKAMESAWDAVRSAELKRDRRYALALLVESYRMKAKPKSTAADASQPPSGSKTAGASKTAAATAVTRAANASSPTTTGQASSTTPARTTTSRSIAGLAVPAQRVRGTSVAQPDTSGAESEEETEQPSKPGLESLIEAFAKENESGRPMSQEMRAVWVDLLRELGRHEDAIALFKSSAGDESGFSVEMRRELLEMEGAAGNTQRLIKSYRDLIKSQPDQLTWRNGLTRILLEQGKDEAAADLWNDYIDGLEKGSQLLMAAQSLGDVGLDGLAEKAVQRMVELKADHGQAMLYLADLQQQRGRVSDAEATLNRLNEMDDVGDTVRSELASAFERVGRQDKAIEVTEAIRERRKTVAEDVEMRLAWLYSEVGDEEKALQQWLTLWRKITSIPRRRYVEDRLMTVASRLGTLADIAIELEEKLADGNADDREAGLLVRIYSRVNDSVAASEILEDYMTQTGRNEIERLQEKGRIYQVCNDYWNYEKVVNRLIEIDPEGETEYLRQLALSMLERGKAQEARDVLLTLRDADDGKDSIGGEFEAGVLSLVGMNREAADAYRRGIATYPDRIESFLLLANLLKEMGQTDRAVGMFQYLAENAERDDLFTIAIDGLLNMEAKGKTMQWARRITLERLAGREDKNYLYQLLADLSAEVNDKSGQIRAMENSLAVSGTRRLSVLRECMDLSSRIRGGAFYSTSSRGPTNAGNKPFFAFGRRLIGLGELMPPQVFLDLGQAFLADGDVASAERTFGLARNLADQRAYASEVAGIFEKAGKRAEALLRYERLLRTSPSNVSLIARVAKLNEQEGKDDIAFRFYQRGLNLLLAQTPLTTQEESSGSSTGWSYSRNRDAYDTYSDRLLRGLLVTASDDVIDTLLQEQRELFDASLTDLNALRDEGRTAERLSDSPRLQKMSDAMRRMYYAFDRMKELESMELAMLEAFGEDKNLLAKFARQRASHGRYDSVRRLYDQANPNDDQKRMLATVLGDRQDEELSTQRLSPNEMWQRFLPVWMSGDQEKARGLLRRIDQSKGVSRSNSVSYVVINGVVVPQTSGSGSLVSSWMRMALQLGDEGLALQFARSRLQRGSLYGSSGIKQLFDGYREILPADSFQSLARFAANLYKDDEKRRVEYLWILSQLRDQLGDEIPTNEKLLEMVEESKLSLGYQFPFSLAMETFPEAIRTDAIAHVIDGIPEKYRPRELMRIPFQHDSEIDAEISEVILDGIKSGVEPALQDNYLRYAVYYLPRQGTALQCPENAELALAALDLLCSDAVKKRNEQVASIAQNVKAVILHQAGRTEEALDIALPLYDPEKRITDYYERYSRDWVQRELIPVAPQRFLEVLDKKIEDGKPTTPQTDQRLALIRQSEDDDLLRQAYEKAIVDHKEQSSKYFQAYERWEQRAGRINRAIAVLERQLSELSEEESDQAKAAPIKQRLASLWFSVNHRVNGLPLWVTSDDEARKSFEAEKKARAAKEKNQADGNSKPESETNKRASDQASPETKSKEKKKEYPGTIVGVKSALNDENQEAARRALREVWRYFPAVVESPYGYRSRQKNFDRLYWPADASQPGDGTSQKGEPSEEELAAAEKAQRDRQRGGLATLEPPPQKEPAKKPDNAWHVLAEEPVGVSEMRRLVRSRQTTELANVSQVLLGLLRAERLARGDDAVLQSLISKIEGGRCGTVELTQFFAMLEEDPSRISESNQSVVDVLLGQLDLTQLKMASQLAKICGSIGQRERASFLYRHCALLAPSQGVTFSSLIQQAQADFEGDEMITLAEQMFEVTNRSTAAVNRMLDLRIEMLDPQQAEQRSRELFTKLDQNPIAYEFPQAIRGAVLFAQAGKFAEARKCVRCALLQHGQPPNQPMPYYSSGNTRTLKIPRNDLLKVFPSDSSRFTDYAGWLSEAAAEIEGLVKDDRIKPDVAVEWQSVIALRQCGIDSDAAVRSLECITEDLVNQAKTHELLAIDVLRKAGVVDRALALQTKLYEQERLSHVRFGDLLQDTLQIKGEAEAVTLAEELLDKSMDQDLLEVVAKLSPENEEDADSIRQRLADQQAAEEEYQARMKAAKERAETRAEWKKADTENKKQETPPSNRVGGFF